MTIEPNGAKHQEIILRICKKHNVKSLELTSRCIQLMDDCIVEALSSLQSEIEELQLEVEHNANRALEIAKERDDAQSEITQLKAERDDYRKALGNIVRNKLVSFDENYPHQVAMGILAKYPNGDK
jgi:uncharacterized coiled-coil DUF342 family protein